MNNIELEEYKNENENENEKDLSDLMDSGLKVLHYPNPILKKVSEPVEIANAKANTL